MEKFKKIIVHYGLPKTGTTYLQELLKLNRVKLSEHNYIYPVDPIYSNGESGNGRFINFLINSGERFDASVFFSMLRKMCFFNSANESVNLCENQTVIISSETLSTLGKKNIQRFVKIVSSVSDKCQFIGVTRNRNQLVESLYYQGVKQGLVCDFTKFCKDNKVVIDDLLKATNDYAQAIHSRENAVHSLYEYDPTAVPGFIYELIPEAPINFFDIETRKINKSLTKPCASVLRLLNEYRIQSIFSSGDIEPVLFINELINTSSSPAGSIAISEVFENLKSINDSSTSELAIYLLAQLLSLLQKQSADKNKILHEAAMYLYRRNLEKPNFINSKFIPDNFDPVAYLLLNPDVLQAGVNPYAHYIDYGCSEFRRFNPNDHV